MIPFRRGMKPHVRLFTRGATAALFVFLAGCDRGMIAVGRELVVPVENDIQTLDPAQLSDPITSRIVWQIYEGLVGLGIDGETTPVLAKSWSVSSDFKRWSFVIRNGVRFHASQVFGAGEQARVLRAEDVRYSYERFAKGFGSFVFSGLVAGFDEYAAGRAQRISGFAAPSDSVFEVTLTRPDPAFLYRLTSPYLSVMPREAVEASGSAFGRTVAVGTGPFRLLARSENEVKLEANPTYWRQRTGNLASVVRPG